jgi:hypothetical protein
MELARLDGEMSMDLGDLRLTRASGPFRIDTQNKDIQLENVSGDVKVNTRNGEVVVSPAAPFGDVTVNTKNGSIRVGVPTAANYQVQATSRKGEAETDFELNKQEENNDARISGTIGKGGPRLELDTEHGTIEIRKGAILSGQSGVHAPSAPATPGSPEAARDEAKREADAGRSEADRLREKGRRDAARERDKALRDAEKARRDAEKARDQAKDQPYL